MIKLFLIIEKMNTNNTYNSDENAIIITTCINNYKLDNICIVYNN